MHFCSSEVRCTFKFSIETKKCFPPNAFIVLKSLQQPCSCLGKPVENSFTSLKFYGSMNVHCVSRKPVKPSTLFFPKVNSLLAEIFIKTLQGFFHYSPPIFTRVFINFSFCHFVRLNYFKIAI